MSGDRTVLLFGSAGQVGWQLRRSLAVLGRVVALDRHSKDHCGDLSNLEGIADTVRSLSPALIVNAAAYTAVDRAETEEALAFAINATACEVLAREAQSCGAWLVHYSTDYVFDGSGDRPWREDDAVSPVNTYGRSKLAGEEAIRSQCSRHLILRTSWVYDAWGQNFLKTILRAAAQRDALDVVNDQWGAPTRAALIADVTAQAVPQLRDELAGTYHLAAAGETHWHGYASFAVQEALACGVRVKAMPASIREVDSTHFRTAAKRPANSRLDTGKLRSNFRVALPDWRDGVSAVVRELAAHGALGERTTP